MGDESRILVVDDDPRILQIIDVTLSRQGFSLTTVTNGKDALQKIGSPDQFFHCVIADLVMPEMDGMELLENIREINPEIPIIIMTAFGTIESAVEAIKKGAYDYISKPFRKEDLLQKTLQAVEKQRLTTEVKELRAQVSYQDGMNLIIGQSPQIEEVLKQIHLVAGSEVAVIIYGESGTGKELAAKAIHNASSRANGPFVIVNCGAIPHELMENELFGHAKGAYTDAYSERKGLFEEADGGTIFLDEIGEIDKSLQVKMLRTLQDHKIKRVGSSKTIDVNVRVIAATNKNLLEEIRKGNFREDLYYRLNVIPITMPPLRDRKEDIYLLAKHFLKKFRDTVNNSVEGFSPEAISQMMAYDWPGNVRELENKITQAMVLARSKIISEKELNLNYGANIKQFQSFQVAKREFEKQYTTHLLELTKGNVSRAAKLAKKDRKDFYEVMKKYNIKAEDFRK